MQQPSTSNPPPAGNLAKDVPPPPQTWLTKRVKESPMARAAFLKLITLMGYGSAKQYAGRRAFAMYTDLCVPRPDEESAFWKDDCHLPPTFQSWFTITNLHVWLLTVRLRALPPPLGTNYVQGLIDHFFLDIEDRVRTVLQPVSPNSIAPPQNLRPYTTPSDFYTVAGAQGKPRPKGSAPERLVTRQMKIFKEQWAGMGMSLDYGLVHSDAELAAAVWRNLLGARGARGIAYPSSEGANADKPFFRRTINLVGGEVEKVEQIEKVGYEVEESRDDGSGIHDFPPAEVDKYVRYPELMATLVEYIRRETVRLQNLPDEQIIGKQDLKSLRSESYASFLSTWFLST
ncbi:hypothetical protein BD309DRAFT_994376 [Dichomitus squalens]|nr:hypothetical protein BD309DRAFT_994376 [Dichomitus squalens]